MSSLLNTSSNYMSAMTFCKQCQGINVKTPLSFIVSQSFFIQRTCVLQSSTASFWKLNKEVLWNKETKCCCYYWVLARVFHQAQIQQVWKPFLVQHKLSCLANRFVTRKGTSTRQLDSKQSVDIYSIYVVYLSKCTWKCENSKCTSWDYESLTRYCNQINKNVIFRESMDLRKDDRVVRKHR